MGRSLPLTNERGEYFPREDIIVEIEQALASHQPGEIDWVVVGIITRHPMQEDELIETLKHFSLGEVTVTLTELEKSGKAKVVERYGTRFWSASPAYFPALKPKR